jgi:hypothetical protein
LSRLRQPPLGALAVRLHGRAFAVLAAAVDPGDRVGQHQAQAEPRAQLGAEHEGVGALFAVG